MFAEGKKEKKVPVSDLGYASLNPVDESELSKKNDFNTHSNSLFTSFFVFMMMVGMPIGLFYVWLSCTEYQCAMSRPVADVFGGKRTLSDLWQKTFVRAYDSGELFNLKGLVVYLGFAAVQAVLALILPGKTAYGQITPGGNKWKYHINGLNAVVVSAVLFYVFSIRLRWFEPSIFYDNWGSVIMYSNLLAYALVFFLYAKACIAPSVGPSGSTDCNFSGNLMSDLYKGVELNPRIGDFDLKMFCVSRIGMMSWAFINLSAAFKQYAETGEVCNAMILINIMQYFYIHDLLVREEWYLSTIDIMLDRGGFYIFWGVCCAMQVLYVLQSLWLLHNPVNHSVPWLVGNFALHVVGYTMFLDSNTQRVRFREDMAIVNNDASKVEVGYLFGTFFNRKPTYVTANWVASDGKKRTSLLLTSGYWGLARHFNYFTDLCMCFAWGLSSGTFMTAIMPWTYFFFMIILLVHRAHRDERRLLTKYGKDYLKYCDAVPYNVLPGVL